MQLSAYEGITTINNRTGVSSTSTTSYKLVSASFCESYAAIFSEAGVTGAASDISNKFKAGLGLTAASLALESVSIIVLTVLQVV